jgi:hypothetical protein
MEKAGYIVHADETAKGRGKRFTRLATFADKTLTSNEEEELLKYLAFLRSRKSKS